MFQKGIILLVIAVLAHANNSTSTIQSTQINATNCIFNYNQSTAGFDFINCTTQSGSSSNWHFCVMRCCNKRDVDYYNPTLQSILECQKTPQQSSVTIVIGVLVGLFSLIVIICFFVIKCKLTISLSLRNRIIYNTREAFEVEWPEQKVVTHSPPLKWSKNASQDKPLQLLDTPCSICLEDGTTAELICKHQYHPECIGGWLNKSQACPICRKDNIKGVKVFCKECRWRYVVCSRTYLTSKTYELTLFCKECKNPIVSTNQIKVVPKQDCQFQNKQVSRQQIIEFNQAIRQQNL